MIRKMLYAFMVSFVFTIVILNVPVMEAYPAGQADWYAIKGGVIEYTVIEKEKEGRSGSYKIELEVLDVECTNNHNITKSIKIGERITANGAYMYEYWNDTILLYASLHVDNHNPDDLQRGSVINGTIAVFPENIHIWVDDIDYSAEYDYSKPQDYGILYFVTRILILFVVTAMVIGLFKFQQRKKSNDP